MSLKRHTEHVTFFLQSHWRYVCYSYAYLLYAAQAFFSWLGGSTIGFVLVRNLPQNIPDFENFSEGKFINLRRLKDCYTPMSLQELAP